MTIGVIVGVGRIEVTTGVGVPVGGPGVHVGVGVNVREGRAVGWTVNVEVGMWVGVGSMPV